MNELCGDVMPDISDRRPTCALPAGHESRTHRSAPPVYVWAPLYETGTEPACKECGHPWTAHSKMYGCEMDWRYDADGIASVVGCECALSHASLSPDGAL
jgi:hypothetical protein